MRRLSPTLLSIALMGLSACATQPVLPTARLATDAGRCEAEKLLLTATADGLRTPGVPMPAIERWLERRRGADRVEGTADDALLSLVDARAELGEETVLRIYGHHLAAGTATPCGNMDVQLLAFNDFHGALEPPTGSNGVIRTPEGPVDAGGLAFLATTLRELTAANPTRTLVVGAGDMIGATPLISAAFKDEPTLEGLALAGLAITSVGNHEFDEGFRELLRLQHGGCHPVEGCFREQPWPGARFQYLAANVTDDTTNKPILPPWTVRRFGHVKVGFIGMTLEGTPDIVRADGIAGIRFHDEVETAAQYAFELKSLGVQTIVVLLHEGGLPKGSYRGCEEISGPVVDIAAYMTKDVDLIVSGHTHAPYICDIAGKLVTSAAANGRLVTDIDLVIDEATGRLVSRTADNIIARRTIPPAPDAEALVSYWQERVRGVASRVVGRITADLKRTQDANGQSDLGGVIADAHLFAERDPSTGGAQVAFINSGGIRADLPFDHSTNGESPGEITFGEAFAVQPFQNELITVTLTTEQFKELLESQFTTNGQDREKPKFLQSSRNLAYTWNPAGPPGNKVDFKSIRVDGKALKPRTTIRVVCNAYLAAGGDDYPVLARGTDRRIGIYDIDAFVHYLAKHAPVGPPPAHAIRSKR